MSGITTTLFQRPRDPQFNNTTLLLSGNFPTNGAQNNTFLDSSSNNFTITRNPTTGPNAPTQGTFSPFSHTGWSAFNSGSGSVVTYPTGTFTYFGTRTTIEMWIFPTAFSAGNSYRHGLLTNQDSSGALGQVHFQIVGGTGTTFTLGIYSTKTNTTIQSTITGNLNQWNHVVVQIDCVVPSTTNQVVFAINGTTQVTSHDWSTLTSTGYPSTALSVGGNGYFHNFFIGHISNLRVVQGSNYVYGTSNFTPPTAPITPITGTQVLLCQSNRFVDTNTQLTAKTITIGTGVPSVQAFSPFAPSGAYDRTAVGGSGYFDGTGDSIFVSSTNSLFNIGASVNFTYEAWFYSTSVAGIYNIISLRQDGSGWAAIEVQTNTTRNISLNISQSGGSWNTSGTSAATFNLNTWNHVAVVRSGGSTINLYLNGVSVLGPFTNSNALYSSPTEALRVAARPGGGNLTGYIAGVRYINGQALTTGSFTPPTAPVTATSVGWTGANVASSITGTVAFLCNFTNAGIVDSVANKVLETVGNAQISTTQSRFGGTSMSFDGTNSVVALRGNSNITQFGTGDFTVEMWLYPTTFATYKSVWCCSTSAANATGFHIGFNASGQMFLYSANSFQIASSANSGVLTINTWNHVAVQRTGSTVRIFVNGVAATSTWTLTTQSFTDGACLFGATPAGNSEYYAGFIDDARITRGVARYSTTGFNVPTIGFTDR